MTATPADVDRAASGEAALAIVTPLLEASGQSHVLRFAGSLDDAGKRALAAQVASIDLSGLGGLVERYVKSDAAVSIPDDLSPADYYPRDAASGGRAWDEPAMRAAGEAMISAGKVACFTVAGGQGSRLGYDGPKGCYPTGAVTEKPLFQIFAEGVLGTERTYGCEVPWYIMTSPLNHSATVVFFEENAFFGLDRSRVMFFEQGTMPSLDKASGGLLLAERGKLATNPDGHGGSLKALVVSGATEDMRRRGVEHISYFQVDNPNVRVADPVFIGLHASAPDSSGEMSSKMLPKAEPKEKVGVFCKSKGRTTVIEYSDMPEDLAEQRHADGGLTFLAGSIAIHAISVAFVEKVVSDPAFELPFHRAIKKVPHVDLDSGEPVQPAQPNAVKLERFVFDAVPLATGSIVYETDRVEEFAPVKNKEGVDSIVTSKQLQTERAARWLEAAGTGVPRHADGTPDCVVEISPLFALSQDHLSQRKNELPARIDPGSTLSL
ncbi:MAG: UDPGP type 1 family protein [Planctomycetota bacterium]